MTKVVKYVWKDGSRIGIPAQPAGEAIDALRESRHGNVRPEDVVEEARAKESPLHGYFDWNNARAAESWRRQQAVHVLNCLVAVEMDGREEVRSYRAYVVVENVAQDDSGEVYVRTVDALRDPVMRDQVLTRALREHELWERRYRDLVELADVVRVAREVRQKVLAGVR